MQLFNAGTIPPVIRPAARVTAPAPLLDSTGISRTRERVKAILSGSHLEVYLCERGFRVGSSAYNSDLDKDYKITDRTEEYRKRNAVRGRNHVRRLIQHNFGRKSKFLTLTFARNGQLDTKDLSQCYMAYSNFIRRLTRRFNELKYITVVEFHKSGDVHFHMVCDLPFIANKDLSQIWNHGFTIILAVKTVERIGLYLSKYFFKSSMDLRLKGKRRFYCSKNLAEYSVFYGVDALELFRNCIGLEPSFKTKYYSEFAGVVKYFEYYQGRG